jgi:trehalose synthase-fused probable maltokinase
MSQPRPEQANLARKRDYSTVFKEPFEIAAHWSAAFESEEFRNVLSNEILPRYIVQKRWYAGKSSTIKYIEIVDVIKVRSNDHNYYGILIEVNFIEAFFQNYFIPVSFMLDEELDGTNTLIAPAIFKEGKGYLVDALHIEDFRALLFQNIVGSIEGTHQRLTFDINEEIRYVKYESSRFMSGEQSNTSIIYNERFVLKIFRRIFSDPNPDFEVNRFLTEVQGFENCPKYRGSLNMQYDRETVTLALMQDLVENQGDAWKLFSSELVTAFKRLEEKKVNISHLPKNPEFNRLPVKDVPSVFVDWTGLKLYEQIEKLAQRTAQMHTALGSNTIITSFTPATFNSDYDVWLKNRLIHQFQTRINTLENNMHQLKGETLKMAEWFLGQKKEIRKQFLQFDWTKLKGERTRIHGDFHLGQVLVQGDDFFILDFEGEPESTIRDRKVKQPPLKDVAGIFRSFHYAVYSAILTRTDELSYDQDHLFEAAEKLYSYMVGVFYHAYMECLYSKGNLSLGYTQEREFLLRYHLIEKAVYELGYELNSRPRWAIIPLRGIRSLLKTN